MDALFPSPKLRASPFPGAASRSPLPSRVLALSPAVAAAVAAATARARARARRLCSGPQNIIQALDEMLSAAEPAQRKDAKSVNDAAASEGIRIRRHCRPTASTKEVEEEMGAPRNILEKIIWDKEIEVAGLTRNPLKEVIESAGKAPISYHQGAHAEQARFVKGNGITNPDLLGMEDGLAAFESPPPLLNEGHGAVTNKVDGQAHTNEVPKNKPTDWISGLPVTDDLGRLQIIKNDDLEELQELGSGTFGTVYHGKWRGSDVAIKRINDRCFAGKPSEQGKMRHDFWNEASNLADLHHPNVVAFYGVVLDGPGGSIATVTEYMVNGSLRTALLKNSKSLDQRKRLIIAMDTAFGMEYLHNKNIVHFDLKSDNLLVNLRDPQRPICKVGDLGLSKVKCQTLISGGVRGTLPWMAPELLNGSSSLVSEKVDVFSFGIVLWELLTGEEPYADLYYGVIIGGIVSNTLRPPVPDSCDPEWRSLMEQCWSTEPSERPSFTQIAVRLRSMAASQKVQS